MNAVVGWNEIVILQYLAIPGRCQSLHAWSPPSPSPNTILVAYYQQASFTVDLCRCTLSRRPISKQQQTHDLFKSATKNQKVHMLTLPIQDTACLILVILCRVSI